MFRIQFTFFLFALSHIPMIARGQDPVNKDSLIKILFVIDDDDEKFRNRLDEVEGKYGADSREMEALFAEMKKADSVNLIKVSAILDQYGWLGVDDIGEQGNTTLFMVIQHSDLDAQLKYLPVMREAVKNGKAKAGQLALLEDRVALEKKEKQVYGSQVSWNRKTGAYYLAPLIDPDNVDQRRKEVGLPPLADYLSGLGIQWDPEQYKKDLPSIEAEFFKK